uniref:RNase H type-1 domain-containing protein n=1 Tax=Fagus sylvatica TaxID=28930 RepID=A0A2N9GI78_FAGSY
MAEEASKLRGLEAREEKKEGNDQQEDRKEIYPALSLSKAAQTLPTPRRPAFHIPRPSRTEPRQFQPLPIPVPQLYTLLVKKKMITPVGQRTRIGPQPKDYNKDLTCEYHQGEVGYTVENCRVLRHRIQDLLDQGVLKFRIEGVINTNWEDPIRRRGEQPEEYCMTIDQLRLSPYERTNFQARMERIKEDFEKFCEKKKEELGKLTPATPPEMSKPDPVVIQYATKEKFPRPFPYHDNKRVPWNYGMKIISTREGKPKIEEEVVGNLTSGLGGITRSGRCYTPEELEKRRKEIGKTMVEDPAKTKVAEDEAADFLRIIKSSEYSVVKQLSKMPSHISVLALLLASESHRKALLKITNQLTFSDDELPPEGRGHVKALYISVKTNDRIVSRVLIDNGSALNVCPLSTLEKLDIDPTRVRVTSMVVRSLRWNPQRGIRRDRLASRGKTMVAYGRSSTLLPTPENETHHWQPIGHHPRLKNLYPFTMTAKSPTLTDVHPKEASFHSFEFVTVITEYGLGYTPTRKDRQMAYEARRQRAAAKLRGEKWPEKKMVIPHIRTTFPASAMFQVDEGDVDELALLFAEDLDRRRTFDGRQLGKKLTSPNLLPHLMISRGLETLEFEMFCEHEDPESHLQRYRKKMALDRYRHNLKTPPPSNITTTTAEEEYAGPMVEGLSIHTIAEEEDSTATPPTRHCQQGEEAKMWTCVPLLQRVSSSNEVKNREKSRLGTRCTTEQKEALIALLREFHEIFAWSYQDMPGLDTDIVVHKIPLKPECKPVKQALRRMKPEVILKIKEEGGKAIEGRFPKHSNLFGLGSQHSPSAEKGWKTTNAVFSFMDGFSGYNQIKMAEEDKSKTAFVTHWGTFVYDVMPFGLKNAGATYQRAMVTLFHDMIHHEIEVYVDDMIAKSRTAQDHLTDLRKLFQRLKKGIEIDPAKVQAIRSMPAPKTEKEIRSFLGRINYIARFIAQLTATCEPLFKLLRKDVKIKWTEDCQRAFDKIKEYLLNPPILVPPTPGRPLILYLTVQEASMGCMLGQQDETGKKGASNLLSQQEAIKGQAIADYLADYPSEQLELMDSEFPDEDVMTVDEDNHGRWKLYFDGAANAVGSGIGAVLVSPKGQQTPIAVKLGFDCTNNMTEYEACIVGLQAALEFGAYELEVFGDSLLIVSQTNGEWQARDPKLIPYQRYISRLVPKFKYVTFTYTPRAHNHFADALATLASLIKLVEAVDTGGKSSIRIYL